MNTSNFSHEDLQTATKGKWYNIDQTSNDYCKKSITSVSTDTRINNNGALFLALSGERFDAHNFINEALMSGASALCLQKGKFSLQNIPSNIPVLEVSNTLKAYQNIANSHRRYLKNLKLIAVTGSNGKTSTKDILRNILSYVFGKDAVYTTKANTNNLIGVPLNILNLNNEHRFAVIELGSNHPGEIEQLTKIAQPDIAIITSIGPSHLEYFHNIDGVLKEKASILSYFNNQDSATAILPSIYKYNSLITEWTKNIKVYTFGNDKNADITWNYKSATIDKTNFELTWNLTDDRYKITWQIPGIHQISNAAAAATAATVVGISQSTITKALKYCSLSGMRMRIHKTNGITWINDAYNANPASTKAGIDWLYEVASDDKSKKVILVLGDMLELGENSKEINNQVIEYATSKLPYSIIVGVGAIMSEVIKEIKEENQHDYKIFSFNSTDSAIPFFQKFLETGSLIYLKGSRGIALEKIERAYC